MKAFFKRTGQIITIITCVICGLIAMYFFVNGDYVTGLIICAIIARSVYPLFKMSQPTLPGVADETHLKEMLKTRSARTFFSGSYSEFMQAPGWDDARQEVGAYVDRLSNAASSGGGVSGISNPIVGTIANLGIRAVASKMTKDSLGVTLVRFTDGGYAIFEGSPQKQSELLAEMQSSNIPIEGKGRADSKSIGGPFLLFIIIAGLISIPFLPLLFQLLFL